MWRETPDLPNEAVPNVIELLRTRAVNQAKERGIEATARTAAEQWFKAFLAPFGGNVEIRAAP